MPIVYINPRQNALKRAKARIFSFTKRAKTRIMVFMSMGKKLRKLIKEQGLLQKWVAQKADMSEANLQRILDDKHSPGADSLAGLAGALGVSADFLLGLTDDPTPRSKAV